MIVELLGGPKDGVRMEVPAHFTELVWFHNPPLPMDRLLGRVSPTARYVLPIRDGKAHWYERKEL